MEANSSSADAARTTDRRRISRQTFADINIPFPIKLHTLLENEVGSVILWLSHGKSFRVEDPHRFVNEIIYKYFKRENIIKIDNKANDMMILFSLFSYNRCQND